VLKRMADGNFAACTTRRFQPGWSLSTAALEPGLGAHPYDENPEFEVLPSLSIEIMRQLWNDHGLHHVLPSVTTTGRDDLKQKCEPMVDIFFVIKPVTVVLIEEIIKANDSVKKVMIRKRGSPHDPFESVRDWLGRRPPVHLHPPSSRFRKYNRGGGGGWGEVLRLADFAHTVAQLSVVKQYVV
jgi:hypothetical protein